MQKIVTLPGEPSEAPGQRDNGKTYIITAFNAYEGQKWVVRAALALAKVGIKVDAELLSTITFDVLLDPMLTPAVGLIDYQEAMALIDGLLSCVKYRHTPETVPVVIPQGDNRYVQEIKTRNILAQEVWDFHRAFF